MDDPRESTNHANASIREHHGFRPRVGSRPPQGGHEHPGTTFPPPAPAHAHARQVPPGEGPSTPGTRRPCARGPELPAAVGLCIHLGPRPRSVRGPHRDRRRVTDRRRDRGGRRGVRTERGPHDHRHDHRRQPRHAAGWRTAPSAGTPPGSTQETSGWTWPPSTWWTPWSLATSPAAPTPRWEVACSAGRGVDGLYGPHQHRRLRRRRQLHRQRPLLARVAGQERGVAAQ